MCQAGRALSARPHFGNVESKFGIFKWFVWQNRRKEETEAQIKSLLLDAARQDICSVQKAAEGAGCCSVCSVCQGFDVYLKSCLSLLGLEAHQPLCGCEVLKLCGPLATAPYQLLREMSQLGHEELLSLNISDLKPKFIESIFRLYKVCVSVCSSVTISF